MTKIDIFSGFLGAGKTTLIKKLIEEAFKGEKLVGLFNFSEFDEMAWINEQDGDYVDLLTGKETKLIGAKVPGNGFFWMKRK